MEQVYYSKPRDPSETSDVGKRKRMSKCSTSSQNLMAFSAQVPNQEEAECRFKISVIDLNIPWHHHQVAIHDNMITCIEWNSQGTHLMVCDEAGFMLIYKMEGHILNNWTLTHKQQFPGEPLLDGVWFHHGKKIEARIHGDDHYLKKYGRSQFSPSLKPPLNSYADGCLAISEFGAVCVMIIPKNADEKHLSIVKRLFTIPPRLRSVDICYGVTGDFLVAANKVSASYVNFFRITLSTKQDAQQLTTKDPTSVGLEKDSEGPATDQASSKRAAEEVNSVGPTESAKKSLKETPVSKIKIAAKGENSPAVEDRSPAAEKKIPVANVPIENEGKNTELEIFLAPLASLLLPSLEQDASKIVTHIRFLYKENPERVACASIPLGETPHGVVVSVSGATESSLELWVFREEATPNPKHVETTTTASSLECAWTLKWQRLAVRGCRALVTAIATPRRYIYDNKPIPTQVVVAFNNYNIQRFQGHDLDGEPVNPIRPGHALSGAMLPYDGLGICFSKTGSILMVVDAFNSQISMFRVGVLKGLPSGVSEKVPYLTSLLESCIIGGEDWLDVMLASDSESAAEVAGELLKNYYKQPGSVKFHCYDRFLTALASLSRIMNPKKEGEYFARILLRHVCLTIAKYPRSRQGVKALTEIIENREYVIYDIHEAIRRLQSFDFNVSPARLSGLRNYIQWLIDLALNIALPSWIPRFADRAPLVRGLIADKKSVHLIRVALVLIRIWERTAGKQLTTHPDLIKDFDTVSIAFNLLTIASIHGRIPSPEAFREAWNVLEFRLSGSMMEFKGSATGGLCCQDMCSRRVPIMLEFDKPSDFMRGANIQYSTTDLYVRDAANPIPWWMALSLKKDDKVRRCTRCFRLLRVRDSGDGRGIKYWELHWNKRCPCGGPWAMISTDVLCDRDDGGISPWTRR